MVLVALVGAGAAVAHRRSSRWFPRLPVAIPGVRSFVLLAVIAAALPSAARVPREGEVPERARDGIVVLGRDAGLRLVLGVGFVSLLFMTASASAEVFFA